MSVDVCERVSTNRVRVNSTAQRDFVASVTGRDLIAREALQRLSGPMGLGREGF
jgi:hypothetical protein